MNKGKALSKIKYAALIALIATFVVGTSIAQLRKKR